VTGTLSSETIAAEAEKLPIEFCEASLAPSHCLDCNFVETVKTVLKHLLDDDQFTLDDASYGLTVKSLKRMLRYNARLDDQVINTACKAFCRPSADIAARIHFMDCTISTLMTQGVDGCALGPFNPRGAEFVVGPVHFSSREDHWALFAVSVSAKTIHYYDSMESDQYDETSEYSVFKERLLDYAEADLPVLSMGSHGKPTRQFAWYRVQGCPTQDDRISCGLFVISFAEAVAASIFFGIPLGSEFSNDRICQSVMWRNPSNEALKSFKLYIAARLLNLL
jgi:hypothetical protein